MKILIPFLFITHFFTNCAIRDSRSRTETFLVNTTSYKIEIHPYNLGVVSMSNRVTINPHEKISVLKENPWGRTLNPSYGTTLQPFDSIIVIFDNQYKTTHLSFRDSLLSCFKCINFFSERNISNENNYKKVITKEHKKYLNGYFEYTFTVDDYNFAKE